MTALPTPPSRVQQVYDAIVQEICTGRIGPGTPLRQELLAQRFNVSRQPVQQALLLLKNQGMVREFGKRGLEVTPLDAGTVSHLYQLRAVLDGYAARCAAGRITPEGVQRGRELSEAAQQAARDQNYAQMIAADVEFHRLLVQEAGNPLLVESAEVMWRNVQRVMGEVLFRGHTPGWVWQDHTDILAAVESGDEARAEELARRHAEHGERLVVESLEAVRAGTGARARGPR